MRGGRPEFSSGSDDTGLNVRRVDHESVGDEVSGKFDDQDLRPANASSRLTRLGWHFMFIACFAVLAGSIRSLNLMLILAGLVFGALLMSWRIASRSSQRVGVRRRLPADAMAGTPFQIRYLWTNSAWLTPIWLLRVNDSFRPVVARPRGTSKPSVERLAQLTAQWLGTAGRIKLKCGIGVVPATTAVSSMAVVQIARRGVYLFSRLSVSTKFPLCLVESRRRSDQPQSLYVYPSQLRLRKDWRRRLRVQSGGVAQSSRKNGQEEGEFYGIRGWQHGDSPRWIHWRTTARLTEPAVRQYQKFRRPDLCIILDAYRVDSSVADSDRERDKNFELAISLAATLTTRMSLEAGDAATLGIASKEPMWISETRGRIGYRNFMRHLTEVQACQEPEFVGLADQFLHSSRRPRELLVVSTRSRDHAFLTNPLLMRSLRPWMRRSKLTWVEVPQDLDSLVDSSAVESTSSAEARDLAKPSLKNSREAAGV